MPDFEYCFETYASYKNATNLFVSWLREMLNISLCGSTTSISVLAEWVNRVASQSCSQKKLRQGVRYIKRAKDLRMQVALYYEEMARLKKDNEMIERNAKHTHFIDELEKWLTLLSSKLLPDDSLTPEAIAARERSETTCESNIFQFHLREENIYSNLFNEEGGDSDNKDDAVHEVIKNVDISCTNDNNKKTDDDDVFIDEDYCMDENLKMLNFFFLRNSSNYLQQVEEMWNDVKTHKVHALAASSFTVYAIRRIQSYFAFISLHYPEINSFETFWHSFGDQKSIETLMDEYGMEVFSNEMVKVASYLSTFTTAYDCTKPRVALQLRRGYFGQPYHENTDPLKCTIGEHFMSAGDEHHFVNNKVQDALRLFMQEIPYLYNDYIQYRERKDGSSPLSQYPLMTFLLRDFHKLFETKELTFSLIFQCMCWVKSVAVMQGDFFIHRTNFLHKQCMEGIRSRGEAALSKGIIEAADAHLSGLVEWQVKDMMTYGLQGEAFFSYTFHNPIFAGAFMMDALTLSVHFGELVLTSTSSHYRAACHLYNAFRHEGLIETIPLLENLIDLFGDSLFTGDRSPSHGSYFKFFMLSSHLTASAVAALQKHQKPRGPEVIARKKFSILKEKSDLFSYLHHSSERGSCGAGDNHIDLDRKTPFEIRNLFHEKFQTEMFDTKLINLDLLSLNGIFYDLFVSLRDGLNKKEQYDFCYLNENQTQSDSFRDTMSLEMCTTYEILKILDALPRTSAHDVGELPDVIKNAVNILYTSLESIDIANECSFMSFDKNACEGGNLNEHQTVFGDHCFDERDVMRDEMLTYFCEVMDILEDTPESLTSDGLDELKQLILRNPDVLDGVSVNTEFEHIFAHFVANSMHKSDHMVEWVLLCNGGKARLHNDPLRVCIEDNNNFATRLLLRHSEGCDFYLNTKSKETAMHVAAMCGNVEAIALLKRYNFRTDLRDCHGRLPVDVAKDKKTKNAIKALTTYQTNEYARIAADKDGPARTKQRAIEENTRAEILRNKLQRKQQDKANAARSQEDMEAMRLLALESFADTGDEGREKSSNSSKSKQTKSNGNKKKGKKKKK